MARDGLVPSGSNAWNRCGNMKLSVMGMFLGAVFPTMLFFHRIMNKRTTNWKHWLSSTGIYRLMPSFQVLKFSMKVEFASVRKAARLSGFHRSILIGSGLKFWEISL